MLAVNCSRWMSPIDCLPRIDDAKAMGFDVIYFPPVHPIGVTARKGKNNSVTCQPGEPGVPYAIGNILLTAWGPVLVAMMMINK